MTRKPKCPSCARRLRVKPAPRWAVLQLWECVDCKAANKEEFEWTNSMLQFLEQEKAERENEHVENS